MIPECECAARATTAVDAARERVMSMRAEVMAYHERASNGRVMVPREVLTDWLLWCDLVGASLRGASVRGVAVGSVPDGSRCINCNEADLTKLKAHTFACERCRNACYACGDPDRNCHCAVGG